MLVAGGVSVAETVAVKAAASVCVMVGEGVEVAGGEGITVWVAVFDGDGVIVFVGLG